MKTDSVKDIDRIPEIHSNKMELCLEVKFEWNLTHLLK